MEYTKQSILNLKAAIKEKVAQQKQIKPQRKTVHYSGNRTHPAWQATAIHLVNRYDLRHLYIAYAIMRGKSIDVIEPKRKTEYSQSKVENIIQQYGAPVCDNKE